MNRKLTLEELRELRDEACRHYEVNDDRLLDAIDELIQRRKWAARSILFHAPSFHVDKTFQGLGSYEHIARGTKYEAEELGICSTNGSSDGKPMVVYRGEDGTLWARDLDQFVEFGRFKKL